MGAWHSFLVSSIWIHDRYSRAHSGVQRPSAAASSHSWCCDLQPPGHSFSKVVLLSREPMSLSGSPCVISCQRKGRCNLEQSWCIKCQGLLIPGAWRHQITKPAWYRRNSSKGVGLQLRATKPQHCTSPSPDSSSR